MTSFIIVSYNSSDTLEACLQSLSSQKDSEVILVDNNSSDNCVDIAKKFPFVKLISLNENIGFNGGNQRGIDASSGDTVVLLNPDAVLESNFSQLLERKFAEHPDVAVIGCRILNPDGSLQRTCNRLPSLRSTLFEHSGYHLLFPKSKSYAKYIYSDWDRASERLVDSVSGACTAIRRSTLKKLGRLDTNYFLFYEEADLSQRIIKLSQKILFTPEITIRHAGSTSTKKSNPDFINSTYLASRDYYLKKYYGPMYLRFFYFVKFVFNKAAALKLRLGKLK